MSACFSSPASSSVAKTTSIHEKVRAGKVNVCNDKWVVTKYKYSSITRRPGNETERSTIFVVRLRTDRIKSYRFHLYSFDVSGRNVLQSGTFYLYTLSTFQGVHFITFT